MPKVIEVLVRHECSGQVWYTTAPVDTKSHDRRKLLPSHMEKGVSASPSQIDNFRNREPRRELQIQELQAKAEKK